MQVQEEDTYMLLMDEATPADLTAGSPQKDTIGPTPGQKTHMFSENEGPDPQVSNFGQKVTSPDQRKMYMDLAMKKD